MAFVLTEPQHLLFEDPTFSILLRAAAEALGKRGMPLLLMAAGTPEERRQITDYVGAGDVDGVLVISSRAGSPVISALRQRGVPTVACGTPLVFEGQIGYVEAGETGGARTTVRHLIDCGRQRIATITGPMDTAGRVKSLAGHRSGLGDRFDESLVALGDYTREGGKRAMSELLGRRPDLDAVLVASNLMAAGALTALAGAGRRLPEDVAIGGLGDSGLSETLQPPLTTMRHPSNGSLRKWCACCSR